MKSIVLLGTVHSVRGAEKSPRKQIDDPSYRKLIELFVSCCDVDYIFEEASGCGPTDAEKIANRHSIRYKDVDLHPDERRVESASPHSSTRPNRKTSTFGKTLEFTPSARIAGSSQSRSVILALA